jgi:hypothetical protein
MKVSSLGSNLVARKLRWVVAAVVCWNSAVLTQDRPPITPFKPPITPGDVESARLKANRCRSVSKVHIRNSHQEFAGQHVGFAYVGADGEIGQPVFSLTGTDESLSQISIPLSDIESVTLLKTEEHWFNWRGPDRALMEVIVFPDISPSQLLKSRPTYSQLAASTKSVRLWVSLNDQKKRELTMVATQSVLLTYTRLFSVRDLEPNHKIIFEWPDEKDAPIWWATDTVVADAKYPHRVVEQLALESPTNLSATVTQLFALTASQMARNRLTEREPTLHFATTTLAYSSGKYIVTLRWTASVSVSVVGYNLYRLSRPGSWVKLNQGLVVGTVFEDASVENGMTYRYAATAVGMQNRESPFSKVVAAVIPPS